MQKNTRVMALIQVQLCTPHHLDAFGRLEHQPQSPQLQYCQLLTLLGLPPGAATSKAASHWQLRRLRQRLRLLLWLPPCSPAIQPTAPTPIATSSSTTARWQRCLLKSRQGLRLLLLWLAASLAAEQATPTASTRVATALVVAPATA
jgi:hypothetical protein